ncbi:MAG: indole-3-glycerol phosphate synthase TrpC [Acidimicrobiales bacterium]
MAGPDLSGTYLGDILAAHREVAALDERDLDDLIERVESAVPARGFADALAKNSVLSVIAEVKRRSPSKGSLAPYLDAAEVANIYEKAGASCLSVLTDSAHFGGSRRDLMEARESVRIPVLRKDFTVSLNDICDARAMGADAVLLIAAALDDAELRDFHALSRQLGMDAIIEVHDESEAERALGVGPGIIGVNQRNLHTFEVDQQRAVRVAASLPDSILRVAESGVRVTRDAEALAAAGYDAVLVGEALLTANNPDAVLNSLKVPRGASG